MSYLVPRPVTSGEVMVCVPPLLLVTGSLFSLAWVGLGLGWGIGALMPPSILAGSVIVTGALLGLAGSPSFRHLPWYAFSLSTLNLFTTGVLIGGPIGESDAGAIDAAFAANLFYIGWLLLAIVLAVILAGKESWNSGIFVALFLAGAVTQMPILHFQQPETLLIGVSPYMWFMISLTMVKSLLVAWATVQFTCGYKRRGFLALMVVLALHPMLSWEYMVPSFGAREAVAHLEIILGSATSLALLMGVTFVLHRFSLALRRGLR